MNPCFALMYPADETPKCAVLTHDKEVDLPMCMAGGKTCTFYKTEDALLRERMRAKNLNKAKRK